MSERAISFMCTKSSPLPSLYPHHHHNRIVNHVVVEYAGKSLILILLYTHHHVCIIAIASENNRHQSQKNYHHDFSWQRFFWRWCPLYERALINSLLIRQTGKLKQKWESIWIHGHLIQMKPSNWWCEIFILVTKYLNWRLNLWFGGGGGDAMKSSNWSWNIRISDVIFDLVMEYSNMWRKTFLQKPPGRGKSDRPSQLPTSASSQRW